MEKLDLEKAKIEGQFGLLLREKDNHDNYILFNFEDLEKIINYYEEFKDRGFKDLQKNETLDEISKRRTQSMLDEIRSELERYNQIKNKIEKEIKTFSKRNSTEYQEILKQLGIQLKVINEQIEESIQRETKYKEKLNELS
jgi:arginyl-tRNA synthetase